ncbi:YjbQ family protein, partial [Candidatus Woesearchaeota archaeon]|nr:YjbQ family protein [Candidatus Woesearchaeota archaeon]
MPTYTDYLGFNTKSKQEFINITNQVEAAVEKSGIKDGLVLINPMHITSAVYVNDAESG